MFSFFERQKLNPRWSFTPGETLWRVLFGGADRIAGESRNIDRKTVSFFCIDEATGTPLWKDLRLEESWWVGIEAVHRDAVILHGFEKPDLPGHKMIFVHDLETGAERWRNPSFTFWFAYRETVVAFEERFDKRVGHVLDLSSGKILETYDQGIEPLFPLRQLAREEASDREFRFPEPLESQSLAKGDLSVIERATKSETLAAPLEGIVGEGYLLFSHYRYGRGSAPEAPLLEQQFIIADRKSGKRVFSEILQRAASAPVPDSFFTKDQDVFFVKDQRTLSVIELPSKKAE